MCGRYAGHQRDLPRTAARVRSAQGQVAPSVFTDFDDSFPVSPQELDAIEAFLGNALRDLLAADSERPQTHADVQQSMQKRGLGQ
jgi:hypothetical protein